MGKHLNFYNYAGNDKYMLLLYWNLSSKIFYCKCKVYLTPYWTFLLRLCCSFTSLMEKLAKMFTFTCYPITFTRHCLTSQIQKFADTLTFITYYFTSPIQKSTNTSLFTIYPFTSPILKDLLLHRGSFLRVSCLLLLLPPTKIKFHGCAVCLKPS